MQNVLLQDLMNESGVKFGTSGARGLADNITDKIAYLYTKGFLQYLESEGIKKCDVAVAGDLRPSTPRIMFAVAKACKDFGFNPIGGEFVPSPAVALYGIQKNIPAIMVTGSHIPEDRNGIKYNLPTGEILKKDETGIKAQVVEYDESLFSDRELKDCLSNKDEKFFSNSSEIKDAYINRYLSVFSSDALSGKKIVYYQHSAVGRDILPFIYEKLGANVIKVARSEKLIAVDTEAVRKEDLENAKIWAKEYSPDIILSTDGDSDRPLIFDENGTWVPGDILGVLVSKYLNANAVCAPVSVNSVLETLNDFDVIKRTKIGSPYVIEAMQNIHKNNKDFNIVGYEANGGFLLESDIKIGNKILPMLPTRDAAIVHLSILLLSIKTNLQVSKLVSNLHARVAISNRVQNFETSKSKKFIEDLSKNVENVKKEFNFLDSNIVKTDETDGLRIYFEDDYIVHLRPSGNAPEFRCYVEAKDEINAKNILNKMIKRMEELR